MKLVDLLDDELLTQMTPSLINGYCNTYTFTKSLAEVLVQKYRNDLPIAVVRPAIVLCAQNEPIPGFTEYLHGPNGLSHAGASGFIRVMLCKGTLKTCYVPVDFVGNACIAVIRERGLQPTNEHIDPLPFYNIIDNENGVTWDEAMEFGIEQIRYKTPYSKMIWYPLGFNVSSVLLWYVYSFFLHTIPSMVIDLLAVLSGNKPL